MVLARGGLALSSVLCDQAVKGKDPSCGAGPSELKQLTLEEEHGRPRHSLALLQQRNCLGSKLQEDALPVFKKRNAAGYRVYEAARLGFKS